MLNSKNLNLQQWVVNIKLAIKKANSIPSLPSKLDKYYSHPITRILRVIGGFFAVVVILKKNNIFPAPLDYISMYIALIQLFQVIIISFTKAIYMVYLFKTQPELFVA